MLERSLFPGGEKRGERVKDTHVPILAQVEELTAGFRGRLATKHRSKAAEAKRNYRASVAAWAQSTLNAPRRAAAVIARRYHEEAHRARTGRELEEVQESPLEADAALQALRQPVTTEAWHSARARGQEGRFGRIRNCGTRVRLVRCNLCGDTSKPVPEGCGVARLCASCSIANGKKRRGRFGRARGRLLQEAAKRGLLRSRRAGGRYSEKMLTVTLPHVTVDDVQRNADLCWGRARDLELDPTTRRMWLDAARAAEKALRDAGGSDVKIRVLLLWAVWPKFLRLLRDAFRARFEAEPVLCRFFEWTPGRDGRGHPHFHAWLWSSFIPAELVSRLWADAATAAGVPEPRDGLFRVDVKELRDFDARAVRELMKGGKREALTLSRLYKKGSAAFDYAEGWTLTEILEFASAETVAHLYEVLEGKRLTQASRGFFGEEEAASCPCCWGSGEFTVRFEHAARHRAALAKAAGAKRPAEERGPP